MKFKTLLISLLFILISQHSFAGSISCKLLSNLNNPVIRNNEKFWTEYGELSASAHFNDHNLAELITKYSKEEKALVSNSTPPKITAPSERTLKLEVSNKAQKEIAGLKTKNLRDSFEEFVNTMSDFKGIQVLRNNPGRWHLEKIKAFKNENVYSVRLNGDHRVLFRLEKDELKIMQVNVDDIHNI